MEFSSDYNEVIEWLYRQLPMLSRVGAAAYKPGLDTSIAIDRHFGYPHRKFKSIHIAGTNGKGSTSHALASVLQSQGYKVGLYTSPHLVDFRERIRVNGEMIPKEAVVNFINRYRASGYDGHPSFFELTMMMAFDWFALSGVDYAVIETGMGGRLDSTNIITPIACVITNISKDHTQFLGDTLEQIAVEKAGIIKSGIPVVIGEARGSVKDVFVQKAQECGAPAIFAEQNLKIPAITSLEKVEVAPGRYIRYDLQGDYQKANLRTVLTAIGMLRDTGIDISDTALSDGLQNICSITGLAGRWMKIADSPLVIADTGHNEAGLTYNMNQLQELKAQRPGCRLHFVIGFVADKDVKHILPMFPTEASYYITKADIPRAMAVEELEQLCTQSGLGTTTFKNVSEAYTAAIHRATPNDIIYVGGSTFIVADFLASGIQTARL